MPVTGMSSDIKPHAESSSVPKVLSPNVFAKDTLQDSYLDSRPIFLVMLPGLDGTGQMFKPLLAHLPANITPIVVNYPSSLNLGYADLLPIVLQALPTGAPFVLLGESFGGPLAMLVATTKPAQLKGLVLCATFVTCPQPWVPTWLKAWVPAFPFKLAPRLLKFKRVFGDFASEEMQQALATVKPAVLAYRLQQVIGVNMADVLSNLELPMLYLQGKRDLLVPSSNMARIKALQPSMEIALLDACHLVLQAQPGLASMAIQGFVKRHKLNT